MKHFFKQHRIVKWISILLIVLLFILIIAIIFLKLWPAFGGSASEEDKSDYTRRADNYHDGKFYNDGDFQVVRETDKIDENIISTKEKIPKDILPTKMPSFNETLLEKDVQITWFGHSSMLMQMHSMNILIDPVFSERSSPVSFVGNKRFSNPPIKVEELPHINVLVLSHDHYDHLDYNVIKEIDEKVDHYVVPLGVENHLKRWGVDEGKITNMAWWEETTIDGLTIGCTPARHYSGRSLDDQFATLWASWVFKDKYHQVFESGDGGYGDHFQKIHEKYGDFDFVLIDCAQYDVNWPEVHMFPEEAIQVVQTLGAQKAMPIHWGAFTLANHPWDDSVERFVSNGEVNGIQVLTPYIGETMNIKKGNDYMNRWWKDVQ